MSNIIQAYCTVRGTRALLWHAFGPDALPLEKQERTGVAGNDPQEWLKTVLALSNGQLYIKHSYVFGCFRDAAKHSKRGRGTLQKYVAATLQVDPEIIFVKDRFLIPNGDSEFVTPDTDSSLPVYLDIAGVVNPNTRSRNVRYRVGASKGWEVDFTLTWDKTIVSRQEMEAVALDAGRLVGLGDGRSVGYGRFEVVAFDVEEED
jgi:hypothetical protein